MGSQFLISISILIILIDLYAESHIKNYGSLIERFVFFLNVKAIFVVVKLSGLCGLFLILAYEYDIFFIEEWRCWFEELNIWTFLCSTYYIPIITAVMVLLVNGKSIFRQFKISSLNYNYERLNQIIANLTYILYRVLVYTGTFVVFFYILKTISQIHYDFEGRGLSVFDFLNPQKVNSDNFNRGVYFSLCITTIVFFIFNNTFIKTNSDYFNQRLLRQNFLKYFFISVILAVGIFFGIFSITNAYFNIVAVGFKPWFSQENILGIFPLRVSSIIILVYLLSYIYSHVLDKNLKRFLLLGLLPIRNLKTGGGRYSFDKRETLFFCQISFYILSIALAEIALIGGIESVYIKVLNFSLLFIIDDYIIIYGYTERFRSVIRNHFLRVQFFNILIFTVGVIILLRNEFFIATTLYLIITGVLLYFYVKNHIYINIDR